MFRLCFINEYTGLGYVRDVVAVGYFCNYHLVVFVGTFCFEYKN